MERTKLDSFTAAYIECALWSSTDNSRDDGGDPLDDNYGPNDIADETLAEMIRDCESFQRDNARLLTAAYSEYSIGAGPWTADSYAGHDFWLTRNWHGAGFWDRGLGDLGDRLTDAAKAFGPYDLYVGDDGKIYDT